MRVYEVSKIHNISNKELLALLARNNFTASTHMSVLPPEALSFIEKYFSSDQSTSSAKAAETTVSAKIPKKVEKIDEQKTTQPILASNSILVEPMILSDLAAKLGKSPSELIMFLLKQGTVCAKNQRLNFELVDSLVKQFQFNPVYPDKKSEDLTRFVSEVQSGQERHPVVVVVGHVDHGKTTLLDYIRKSRVVSREKGGITQQLGAYEAKTAHGTIVFLDTPGHAAFSKMRTRGVRAADIAVLVVAADDSVKPQTVEAIKRIKSLGLPIIVAINKIDKVENTQVERVKQDLAQYDLLTGEWGGDIACMPISAKNGIGVDALLEMIILQSQIMDLRAAVDKPCVGFVLEARQEKGIGSVATVMCQQGSIGVGDFFIAGQTFGRIASLIDSYGKRVKKVGPSIPVRVAGFDKLPGAGDLFQVVSKDEHRKVKGSRVEHISGSLIAKQASMTDTDDAIRLMIKADTDSMKEAIISSIEKIAAERKRNLIIVYAGVGDITESDIVLARDTGSLLYCFNVKIEPNALALTKKNLTQLKSFDIIYKLLDDISELTKVKKRVERVEKKIGEALVIKVFKVKKIGTIAGCVLKSGKFSRDGKVTGWRNGHKVGQGAVTSLQRDKKSVKEVHEGFEFAFTASGIDDWEIDDRVECFLGVVDSQ